MPTTGRTPRVWTRKLVGGRVLVGLTTKTLDDANHLNLMLSAVGVPGYTRGMVWDWSLHGDGRAIRYNVDAAVAPDLVNLIVACLGALRPAESLARVVQSRRRTKR